MPFLPLNDTRDGSDDVLALGGDNIVRGFVPLGDAAAEVTQKGFVPLAPSKTRTWLEAAGDTAIDAAKGVVGLGESVVGLTDLATGNLSGKGWAELGFDPARTKQILSEFYSDSRQDANRQVADAKGFVGTTKAMIDNPSAAVGSMVESAPLMIGGAGAVRAAATKMLAARGIVAGSAEAAAFLNSPAAVARLTAIGSAAEGSLTTGSIQEQGRQAGRGYSDTAPAAVAGGALTGLIGFGTSKIPGFKDADVGAALAGMGSTQRQGLISAGKEIAKGTLKEGVLEELPQSAQEQVFTNLATGKPWDEGVAEAAAQGMVAGAGMGGGLNTYTAGRNALTASPKTALNAPPALAKQGQAATDNAATSTAQNQPVDSVAPAAARPEVRLAELELLSEQRSLTANEHAEALGLAGALHEIPAATADTPPQFEDVPSFEAPAQATIAPKIADNVPPALAKQGQEATNNVAASEAQTAAEKALTTTSTTTVDTPSNNAENQPPALSNQGQSATENVAASEAQTAAEKALTTTSTTTVDTPPEDAENQPLTLSNQGQQATENVAVSEAPSAGMVRMYHGGQDTGANGPLWFTADKSYAEGYARKSGADGVVSYVDVPEDHPALGGDKSMGVLPPTNVELPEEISSLRKPLGKSGSAVTPEVSAAEKALATPVQLTSLDRVAEIDQSLPQVQERLAELNDPASGYGPMFDQERQELQNRDRSRAASVVQMQDIARNPDYMRLGTSRTPDSGAPMVFPVGDDGRNIPDTNLGYEDMAVMSDGQRVPFVYAVVTANQVNASNFSDGNLNPAYDSKEPGTLKALNNGRTAGLQAAYMRGKAEKYKAELLADVASHGVPAEVISRTLNPMLVRVYRDADNMPGMAAKSQGQGLSMAPGELARQDAPLLDATILTAYRSGDVTSAANRGFVRAFIGKLRHHGQDVAAMMTADGQLSPAGRARIQAALVQAAYGDADLVGEMFDSQDSAIKGIGTALKTVAGSWADMRDSARMGAIDASVDITGNLVQAVNLIRKSRQESTALTDLAAQVDLLTGQSPDPLTVGLLRFFFRGDKFLSLPLSSEKVTAKLNAYLQAAMGTSGGVGMFDDAVTVDRILESLNNEGTYGTHQTPDILTSAGSSGHRGLDPHQGRPGRPGSGSSQIGSDTGDTGSDGGERTASQGVQESDPSDAAAQAGTRQRSEPDSATDASGVRFSRTDGKSSVLKNGKFKAWPKFNEWTRAEYNDVVSLLPEAYRDDPHRREPLPTKDRDVLYAAVLPEIEALNQELGIPGAFRVDDLGNIIASNSKAPAQAIMNRAVAIADKFNLGIYVTNVKMPFMKPLIDKGFVGESGLGGILMREAGTTQAPLPNPSSLYGQRVPGIIMSYKPRGFNYALFSRNNVADDASPERHALQALSENDELFALPKSDKDTIEGIAADTDPGITAKKLNHPGLVQTYVLTMPNGARAKLMVRQTNPYGAQTYGLLDRDDVDMEVITDRPGENVESVPDDTEDVYIDVSELKEGGQGAKIYNIAATFAHNTGRILIGDPAGLSDEAMRRRTEHMLSSALKFGTTRHLAPHPRQTMGAYGIGVPPLKWTYGDDLGNIKSLIQTSLKSLDHAGSQLLAFDLPTGTFRDSAGRVLDGNAIRSIVESGRRPEGRAGLTTHKRSAVLSALVREESGKGSTGGKGAGILAQLVAVGREFPASSKGIFYSRGSNASGLTAPQLTGIVDAITARWANAPDVVVLASMDDAPEVVRTEYERQNSKGATGSTEGFFYGGKVYLVADQLASPTDAMRVLFHEALGHMGLRGVFGDSLKPILQHIVMARLPEVAAKAKQYGLDMSKPEDALAAAEEVLADMAQDKPDLGFVKRAIAAIRTWMRANVPGFNDLALTDAEIINSYILPARAFVQRGQGGADGDLSFSRGIQTGTAAFKAWFGDSKVVDQDGKPLVVYHGTSADEQGDAFTSFDTYASNYGLMGMGGYFTADPAVASSYTTKGRGTSPSVYPVFLSIKNPLDMDAMADAAAWTAQFDDIEAFHDGGTTNESWYRAAEDMLTDQEIPKYEGAEIMQDGLRSMGFDGITHVGGGRVKADGIRHRVFIAFDPEQIKSATGNNGNFDGTNADIRFSRNTIGGSQPPQIQPGQQNPWTRAKAKVMKLTSPEVIEKLIYEFQDKYIDLKNLRAHIQELGGTITDLNDAYLGEELYHSRLAKRNADFLGNELKPLLADMRSRAVSMVEFESYLHARHAPEANAAMAERNPTRQMIDDGRAKATKDLKDLELKLQHARNNHSATKAIEEALTLGREELAKWHGAQAYKGTEAARTSLSGMSDDDAKAYMDSLTPGKRQNLDELAIRVDAIQAETLDTLERYGLMDRASLTAWRKAYQHYVPLHRDEARPETGSHPIGQGFSVKGNAAKQRTGSSEKVTNILAHIAMQREAALTRGEKNHVVKKLYLMAAQNPDKDFWEVDQPPMIKTIDSRTGFVRTMVDPQFKNLPNVVMVRIAGNDQAIVFNEHNKQAKRLAEAIKNIDVGDLHVVLGLAAKGTRWFASANTQYNPIFGLVNFARDVQSGLLNLTTTPLAGKQKEVAANIPAAMRAIYRERRGKSAASVEWARLWDEYQSVGGITGYKDMFADVEDRAKALTKELDALDRGEVSKAAHAVVDWLSHYNEAMENSVRLAAYKQALDQGISKERAASLAKNLTVNFNRKGRQAREIGALYAFFNASIQGTARMAETLKGPVGKRIMYGGVLLGVVNTLIGMAMMGGDDDDDWERVPEFIKERSIVIPISGKDYLTIPMPLGFHVFPNIGRIATEFALGGQDKTAGRQLGRLLMAMVDSFNPIGGSQNLGQMAAPTVIDPVVALMENRDWTGRPIYRENTNGLDPQPGHMMAKDSASSPSRLIAEAVNSITGGTQYRPGAWSPTPDQLDYVIGQLTGGLGRELLKVNQTIVSAATGDELPPYKVPLVGRLYGNTSGPSAHSEQFYANVKTLNEIENELIGRELNNEDAEGYRKSEPLADLIELGNDSERQIREDRKARRAVVQSAKPGYQDQVRELDNNIGAVMANLNREVTRAQRKAAQQP